MRANRYFVLFYWGRKAVRCGFWCCLNTELLCCCSIKANAAIEEDLWLRCKKSLNVRFGRTKFSCYDYWAEFNIYRRRNIYTFVYKTVWLI